MCQGMVPDVVGPYRKTLLVGEFSLDEQISCFKKGAFFGKLFDRISPVTKNPFVTVNIGHSTFAHRRVQIARIIPQKPEIIVGGLDLPEIHTADRSVFNGNVIGFSCTIIGNRQRVVRVGAGHRRSVVNGYERLSPPVEGT